MRRGIGIGVVLLLILAGIATPGTPRYLLTVRGVGYRFPDA